MLPLTIARRFLSSNKVQSFLIVLGIGVGVSVQIFIGLLIDSLQTSLINQTVGTSPHISITHVDGELFDETSPSLAPVENDARLTKVQPLLDRNVFILQGEDNATALLRGSRFDASDDIFNLEASLTEGSLPADTESIVIGTGLAEALDLKLDDRITLRTAANREQEYRIAGIFDLKVANLNKAWIFTNLETSQQLFEVGSQISSLELQVADVFSADTIATELTADVNDPGFTISNWKEENEQLLGALQGQSISSYMIQVFVLLSVVIAITSILSITVMQKSREIGILKAMGIQDGQSSLIFMFQSFILGLIGASLGFLIGFGLFWSFITFARTGTGDPIVEPNIRWSYATITWVIAVVSATLAGIIPARRSSRLNPIEVINNG